MSSEPYTLPPRVGVRQYLAEIPTALGVFVQIPLEQVPTAAVFGPVEGVWQFQGLSLLYLGDFDKGARGVKPLWLMMRADGWIVTSNSEGPEHCVEDFIYEHCLVELHRKPTDIFLLMLRRRFALLLQEHPENAAHLARLFELTIDAEGLEGTNSSLVRRSDNQLGLLGVLNGLASSGSDKFLCAQYSDETGQLIGFGLVEKKKVLVSDDQEGQEAGSAQS